MDTNKEGYTMQIKDIRLKYFSNCKNRKMKLNRFMQNIFFFMEMQF